MSKEDNKEEAPEQEQSIWRSLGGTLLYLLVIVLLTWVIVTFVGQRTKVDGHSMGYCSFRLKLLITKEKLLC